MEDERSQTFTRLSENTTTVLYHTVLSLCVDDADEVATGSYRIDSYEGLRERARLLREPPADLCRVASACLGNRHPSIFQGLRPQA